MSSVVERSYRFLASTKCAVAILLAIAATSILGTLLPQGVTEEAVLAFYGETSWKARAIIFLGLTDLYHTIWFQALIALLAVNVSLCTAERLPKTLKLWTHREKELNPEKLRKFATFQELSIKKNLPEVISSIRDFLGKGGWKQELNAQGEKSFGAIFSKRQFFVFAIYGVHFSVLMIILGALAGSLFGFKGAMAIPQGDSTNTVKLMRKDKALMLPFEIRCDRFEIKFYPDGTPSEYISEVTVLENGLEVYRSVIKVNEPMTYRGVSFYQATYGTLINKATVTFLNEETGESFELTLTTEKEEILPDDNTVVQLMDYRENFSNFGPAVAIGMLEHGEKPRAGWILINHPDFHGNRLGPYRITVKDVEASYYTGLQVKNDPGIWFVLIGFTGLVLFMLATFYGNPVKVWCFVEKSDIGVIAHIAIKTYRSSHGETIERFYRDFKNVLSS